ncbi:hypothetical protein IFU30_11015 [Plantibacter sp. CFBP 8798]|uniref:hypothetical protein n=1 Tax=Plantibacter sp. CFBP 8798 TaxID=2775268 RepID=UPI001784C346|nr:hypothetical protein [Plantibacter sp. CFBP 8798]MBD8466798.1 hypothetical protein [Plantibacter sp. CFBP 8798]
MENLNSSKFTPEGIRLEMFRLDPTERDIRQEFVWIDPEGVQTKLTNEELIAIGALRDTKTYGDN